ncbi:MAG TPA: lecithin retinol acyltransferase family protein [Bacteroidia bacterium]|nr:lecithin retinol acyltransferase family protein [Bacteroidia bacterium]
MAYMYTENDLVNHYNLKPADRVVVPKSGFQIVQHHALYLGYDEYGQHWIAENKIGIGVTVTRAKDFFRVNPNVTRVEPFSGSGDERKAAVQRALRLHGRPYNLINYNCEHFVNHALKGNAHSAQVANGLGLMAFFLVLGMLSRGK